MPVNGCSDMKYRPEFDDLDPMIALQGDHGV